MSPAGRPEHRAGPGGRRCARRALCSGAQDWKLRAQLRAQGLVHTADKLLHPNGVEWCPPKLLPTWNPRAPPDSATVFPRVRRSSDEVTRLQSTRPVFS